MNKVMIAVKFIDAKVAAVEMHLAHAFRSVLSCVPRNRGYIVGNKKYYGKSNKNYYGKSRPLTMVSLLS